jgi:enamine deaminase RidA (YjgF/YER057c/UK114 family)
LNGVQQSVVAQRQVFTPAEDSAYAGLDFRVISTVDLVFAYGAARTLTDTARPQFDDFVAETTFVLDGIDELLRQAGTELGYVVKTQCWLTDRANQADMNVAYTKKWVENDFPTRCTFFVGLPGGARVAYEMIAVRPGGEFEHGLAQIIDAR